MNGFLEPKHFDSDSIHLNELGYKLFIEKGLGPLIDSHLATCRINRKRPKPPVSEMCRSSRRRHNKKVAREIALEMANSLESETGNTTEPGQ